MLTAGHEASTDNPDNPHDDGEDHHNADVERFRKVFLYFSELECHAGDKDDEEDNIEEGEDEMMCLILTKRYQDQPLHSNHDLYEKTEAE
jgi:hypothetical protein